MLNLRSAGVSSSQAFFWPVGAALASVLKSEIETAIP
jgi:hypothetical protein